MERHLFNIFPCEYNQKKKYFNTLDKISHVEQEIMLKYIIFMQPFNIKCVIEVESLNVKI